MLADPVLFLGLLAAVALALATWWCYRVISEDYAHRHRLHPAVALILAIMVSLAVWAVLYATIWFALNQPETFFGLVGVAAILAALTRIHTHNHNPPGS